MPFSLTLRSHLVGPIHYKLICFYRLGGAQVIIDLVKIIKESLPFRILAKQRHFVEKYEAVTLLYDLPSLVIPCKFYYLPNITFIFFLK